MDPATRDNDPQLPSPTDGLEPALPNTAYAEEIHSRLEADGDAELRAARWDRRKAAEVVPTLVGLLAAPSVSVRLRAINAVAVIGTCADMAVSGLRSQLAEEAVSDVRRAAASALAAIGLFAAEEVVPTLVALAEVRRDAVYGLIGFGPAAASAIPSLARMAAADPDSGIRSFAIRALGGMGPTAASAISTLSEIAVRDGRAEVRRDAVLAPAGIGGSDTAAAVALRAARDDRSIQVRRAAEVARLRDGDVVRIANGSFANFDLRFIRVMPERGTVQFQLDVPGGRMFDIPPPDIESVRLSADNRADDLPNQERSPGGP